MRAIQNKNMSKICGASLGAVRLGLQTNSRRAGQTQAAPQSDDAALA